MQSFDDLNRKTIWDDQTIGSTVKKITSLLKNGRLDNANMRKNPEMLHKYAADSVTVKHALLSILDSNEANAHLNADIHIHDLEFLTFRPMNCMHHDLRFFIKNGLMVDGDGFSTSSARPAKNLFTLVNHIGQILGAGQVNMSGGQSIPFINTFLAPYSLFCNDEELKQAIQMLIFNINMSYVSRGGQAVFSSFNIDLEMPEFLKEEDVVYAGGYLCNQDVYGESDHIETDFKYIKYGDSTIQKEAKRVAHMLIEVMTEGDGNGKPHLFPNIIFQLNDDVDWNEWDDLFELSAKFSLPYFNRSINTYALKMGCRTSLDMTWTGEWDKDLVRTGNLAYISLNLPKYALLATGNKSKKGFYNILRDNLEIASDILLKRRKHSEDCLNKYNSMNFLTQKDENGESYYRIDHSTLSFGIVGLYETVEIMNNGVYDPDIALLIVKFINKYAKEMNKQTGYRWSVIGSPAESTAGRFGIENKRVFGDRANVHGTTGAYYYSNSTHYPVDSGLDIIEKIKGETIFHEFLGGGHILNIFMGELYVDPVSLKKLTKSIYDHTNVGFYTFSNIYTICKGCNKQFKGRVDKCVACDSEDLEVYDRVTGYMQRVSGWNPSKVAEFKDRDRYKVKQ